MDEAGSNTVWYWPENNEQDKNKAKGSVTKYRFYNYTSGYIHHCVIKNLEYDTKYYYELGVDPVTRRFWFVTPPEVGPDVPCTFGLIGQKGKLYSMGAQLVRVEILSSHLHCYGMAGAFTKAGPTQSHHASRTQLDLWLAALQDRFLVQQCALSPPQIVRNLW